MTEPLRQHAPVGTVFRPCAICKKSTDGLCYCDKAFCFNHMPKHLESCEAAREATK